MSATGAPWKHHPFTMKQKEELSSLSILHVWLYITICLLLAAFFGQSRIITDFVQLLSIPSGLTTIYESIFRHVVCKTF